MASTYSPNLRLELITTGEQSGTWGATTNTNLGTLLEQAIGGYESVGIVTGDNTLTTQNGSTDQSRNAVLRLSGSLSGTTRVNCGLIEKVYIVQNDATGAVTFRANSSDTGVSLASGARKLLYCNGTNVLEAVNDLPSGATAGGVALVSISGTQTLTNKTLTSPVITNGGTLTLPTTTDTLVGRATTDTLTNKTLTAPKFADGGFIADANGNEIVVLDTVTSAVNEITVANAATGAGPSISATGSDSNINLNLVPKGTGIVNVSGSQVISVTDNTNAALRVTQLGTGNAILVEDSTNPDSTPFIVTNDGQVVSGSTTSVSGTAGIARFQSNNSLSGFSAHYAGVDASPAINTFLKSRGGAVVNSEDQIGSFRFEGFDGTNYVRAAQISTFVDGTPGTNDMPGRIVFLTTADGASSPTERFRIGSAGQLGIGGASYGTSGQVLTSGGASAAPTWANPVTLTVGTAITLSGLQYANFTNIPAGVNRITMSIFNVVAANGEWIQVQLGTSSGYVTTGYAAGSFTQGGNNSFSDAFSIRNSGSGQSGTMTLVRVSGNNWVSSHALTEMAGGGRVALSGTLDRVRLGCASTLNSGSVNIMYE